MPIYVQHEVLGKLPDVFNAEAIWQAPGLALFSRRPLLRDLLERNPREQRGRAATRCFAHVKVMLPQQEVDDDYHLTRGARARDLAHTLSALHQKDFGDLLGKEQVRYDVTGTDALDPGQIEVRFGHAVYLPEADEKVLYQVSVSHDSAVWHSVCPIYPDQRLALIGADAALAGFGVPAWPFGADSAALLINDGDEAPPELQMRPKQDFDCRFDARLGYHIISAKVRDAHSGATAERPARLLLKIERAAPIRAAVQAPPPKTAVWQPRPDARAGDADAERTALPTPARQPAPARGGENDATYAPVPQQRVSLVALALPRLSRYRDTGADALDIGFDRELNLAPGPDGVIHFEVDATDQLYVRTAAGRQAVAAPASFAPVDQRAMRLLAPAPEMLERYCALLCLAQAVGMPVAAGARFIFGRGSPVLAALRVLDSPRFVRRGGGDDGASADRIGLSRAAFSFEAAPGGAEAGFRIGRLAPAQALFHLDPQLRLVAQIGECGADRPYLLPAGHHLVAGHYVLRFEP